MFDSIKGWLQRNTPEGALIGAIAAAVAGFYTGSLTAHDAIAAVVLAFVAFGAAESHKDAVERQP